ncbi:hypothetical protein J6590_022230 [Homalodisca vitripennis]|nr:hypothetical protein J6590_022230 [Homalodisca vitripennis]
MAASVEYRPVGDDFENLYNSKLNPPQRLPHIKVQGFVVPDYFRKFVDPILNFEVRDDDVWVCSFPKTVHAVKPTSYKNSCTSENSPMLAGVSESPLCTPRPAMLPVLRIARPFARMQIWYQTHNDHNATMLCTTLYLQLYLALVLHEKLCVIDEGRCNAVIVYGRTTWTQEMVWCIANDLNFEAAKTSLSVRFPFFETVAMGPEEVAKVMPDVEFPPHIIDSVNYIRDLPSPRFIKTHLPFHLLPLQLQGGQTGAKIVYVARNAKDTCLSFYHHTQLLMGYTGTLDEFCSVFYNGSTPFSPFWGNIFGYWKRRQDRNLLFLTFEEMKRDLASSVRRTAKFLGKDLTDEQVATLCDHLSFEKMRSNPAVNQEEYVNISKQIGCSQRGEFMRSGKVGEGKEKFSPDWAKRFDQWSEENLRGTGLSFD